MEIASDTSLSFPLTLSCCILEAFLHFLVFVWYLRLCRQKIFLNQSSEQHVSFIQLTLEATSFFTTLTRKSAFGIKK